MRLSQKEIESERSVINTPKYGGMTIQRILENHSVKTWQWLENELVKISQDPKSSDIMLQNFHARLSGILHYYDGTTNEKGE